MIIVDQRAVQFDCVTDRKLIFHARQVQWWTMDIQLNSQAFLGQLVNSLTTIDQANHTHSCTDQLNCCLRNDPVLRQDAPIFLQLLSAVKKLLPLLRCVCGEGFCLEILDHIEPRANSESDHSIFALLGKVDLYTLRGSQKTYGYYTNTRFHR